MKKPLLHKKGKFKKWDKGIFTLARKIAKIIKRAEDKDICNCCGQSK